MKKINLKSHYHLDLSQISLWDYLDELIHKNLMPSRVALLERIEERFEQLAQAGFKNLLQLINSIRKPNEIKNLTTTLDIPYDYLVLLRREIGSLQPKPIPLNEFLNIPQELIIAQLRLRLIDSKQLFDTAYDILSRKELAIKSGANFAALTQLVCLCDLARVYALGPATSSILFELGYHCIKDFLNESSEQLHHSFSEYNKKTGLVKMKTTPAMFEYCQNHASRLPDVLQL